MTFICPTCRRAVEGDAKTLPFRPFCSERCKMVDLGNWLDGAYRITQPVMDDDLDGAELPDPHGRRDRDEN